MHERVSIDSLCFPGATLTDMASYWRELEPRCISFMTGLLPDDLALPRTIIADGGYTFAGMGHLFLWGHQLDEEGAIWDEERALLSRAIDAAAALGAPTVYMLTGGHGALTWEEAAERFSAGIAPCVAQAEAAGVRLAIETTSPLYADAHLTHTLRDTVLLAEMAGVGVSIDLYACWTEAGLKETIERAAPRCYFFQASDYVYGDRSLPSRAVPGDGAVPLRRVLDWLLSAGYDGAVDLELIGPRIDAEGHVEATRRAADNVGKILVELGA
jgi:sugar phosphate isomerase/epimerase